MKGKRKEFGGNEGKKLTKGEELQKRCFPLYL
jgi:hypothetical protein